MKFSDQLKALQAKYENRIAQTVRGTVLGLGDTVIENSPWGDWPAWSEASQAARPSPPYQPGLFKGSWAYGHGVIPEMVISTIDPTGGASHSRVEQSVGGSGSWDITVAAERHYLVNNTPYAGLMETGVHLVGHNLGLGHMVAVAVASFPYEVAANVRP